MKRLFVVGLALAMLCGCAVIEGKDGRKYLGYDLTDWQEIEQELKLAQDECIQGNRMDCWGDPAGGGASGGGADAGGGK